jgi:amino acid transporter/nucleotide-binding universal stress UspA family protein
VSKTLERNLGPYTTTTISIGAMIGSGIFVLPGLAWAIAGPAVVVAYFLAGVVVLPAALSKAEMATAMPEAGGTYLYIDRAMGPLLGTIAGVGAWFSLVFKSAFALVGLGAYLLVVVSVPAESVAIIALGLAVLLLVVNVVGVKQTGRLQAAIVSLVLIALAVFIATGIINVEEARYHPFLGRGGLDLLAATAFVFVSYAGVTKIASVAEEVENPGRNIPLAILASTLGMMVVYTFVVFVVVGVAPLDALGTSLTPMALAAEVLLGETGEIAIALVAILALTSMAKAGILSATRFPLAMSRDDLAPARLSEISDRFQTPVYSIAFTGVVLLFLIAAVDVVELAKLASAFQILVFAFVNAALIAFRESDLAAYEPDFVAPGYPWVQLFGILAGLLLITQLGYLSMGGAVGFVAVGYIWYHLYGRERTEREGVALEALRGTAEEYSIKATEALFATGGGGGTLVATGEHTRSETVETLLAIATPLVGRRGGQLAVIRFEAVPDQVSLSRAAEERTDADGLFEEETAALTETAPGQVEIDEVVTHDLDHALANYVRESGTNLVIGAWESDVFRGELFGEDVDWYMEHAPADFVFVQDRGLDTLEEITVVGDRGPYAPLQVLVADALAADADATIRFLQAIDPPVSDRQREGVEAYHEDLSDLCTAPVSWEILVADSPGEALISAAKGSDLVIARTAAHHILYDALLGTFPDRLAAELDCTVVLINEDEPRRHTFLRYLLQRVAF